MSPFFNGFQLNVVHWTDDAEFALRTPSMIPPPCTFWVDDQSWPQSKVLYTKYYVLEYVSYTLCFSPGRQIFTVGTMRIRLGAMFRLQYSYGNVVEAALFGCSTAALKQQMALNFELVASDQLFSVVLACCKWFKISAPGVEMWHMWQLDSLWTAPYCAFLCDWF